MFKKTSSVEYLNYGEVFNIHNSIDFSHMESHQFTIQNDILSYFYTADQDIYVQSPKGICLLVITKDINSTNYDKFVIHRVVKINKGAFFNFISIKADAQIKIFIPPKTSINNYFVHNVYTLQRIKPSIRVSELLAYYYNIRGTDYSFSGESNNFWEITYVDIGELHTKIDDKDYILRNNQMILYGPGQFHKERTIDKACSYLTIVFDMDIKKEDSNLLLNKVFDINAEFRNTIEYFVMSGNRENEYDEDIMILSLEKTILSLLKHEKNCTKKNTNSSIHQKIQNDLLNEILVYLNENIDKPINVALLCQKFAISRGTLQSIFKQHLEIGPKEYINNLKLKKSRQLIKDGRHTISEVSYSLGFSSVQHFSRMFKKKYGLTPSEFANSIL